MAEKKSINDLLKEIAEKARKGEISVRDLCRLNRPLEDNFELISKFEITVPEKFDSENWLASFVERNKEKCFKLAGILGREFRSAEDNSKPGQKLCVEI